MVVVQISELGLENIPLSTLDEGDHVFGRGDLLKCTDRRVSRNHGVLKITASGVTLTSIHQNPCFYQAASSTTVTILPKDTSIDVSDGDKFAVLNDHVWFKIKIFDDSNKPNSNCSPHNAEEALPNEISPLTYTSAPPPSTTTNSANNHLEPHKKQEQNNDMETIKKEIQDVQEFATEQDQTDELSLESPKKKMKYDAEDEKEKNCNVQNNSSKKIVTQSSVKNGNTNLKSILFSSDEEVEDETAQPEAENVNIDETNQVNENVKIKEELDGDGTAEASTSNGSPGTSSENKKKDKRDRCWYAGQCYRKNAAHREEFSHLGDSDYETDPEDTRPTCAYGAACYRRNKEHRQQYKHPTNDQPSTAGKRTKKGNNNTVPKKRTAKKTYKDSSEDEYDLEDPFLNDSETEYEATSSDGSESDSNWSDDASQESNKRLMKEAKKFVKGQKRPKKRMSLYIILECIFCKVFLK